MKTNPGLLLCLCLGALATLPAQTLFSDSLATGTNWIVNPANQGDGALAFSSSRLNFLVTTPTADDRGFQQLNTFAASSTLSWSATVDVHLSSLPGLVLDQYANLNLMVAKQSDPFNQNAIIALDRYFNTSVVRNIDSYITVNGTETHLTEVLNPTTDATLMISFNHLTAELIYSYDSDGPVGGANFVTAHTQSIAGWSMSGADNFAFLLVGGSGNGIGFGPALASGDGYFQNFAVTAVPEPSTYAALLGTGALGLVIIRRRFREKA